MVNIKDVKKEVEVDYNEVEDVMQLIFDKQKELMEKYWTINERWSLHSPKVQASIRRFSKYTTEETSEAFEEIFKYINPYSDKGIEYKEAMNKKVVDVLKWDKLLHFQEEIADAIHFFVEKMILAWIDDVDILYQEIEDDLLKQKWKIVQILKYKDLEDVVKNNNKTVDFKNITLWELYMYTWRFIYSVNIADNFLRNKEWKHSNVQTNIPWFMKSLWQSLYHLTEFLLASQIEEEQLLNLYILKHNVNKFRIKTKY